MPRKRIGPAIRIRRLPEGEPVWIVNRELPVQDYAPAQDWAESEEM
jgi:hypothetical protein